MSGIMPDHPHVEVSSAGALWDWLALEHDTARGAILITWKAAIPEKYVSRDQVLDALVAYGWIDGRRYVVDTERTAQLITPRKTQVWAQSYKDRADVLVREGRMQKPGHASITHGKASGLWDYMGDVDRLEVPDDLALALGTDRAVWDRFAPSYRRNVLRWIKLAKTGATRNKRIKSTVDATVSGEKIPQM